jgi:molecular chaperone DnaK
MKSAADRLNEVWQAASAELYRGASAKAQAGQQEPGQRQPRPEGAPGGAPKEDEVIDAEVVEEKRGS